MRDDPARKEVPLEPFPLRSAIPCARLTLVTLVTLATALVAASGCASLPPDPEVPEIIAAITPESARAEVEALLALGLRPASDPAASRAALDHLRARLEGWGYTVREESFDASVPRYEPTDGGG